MRVTTNLRIVTESRKYSLENQKFISETIKNDLKEGIIEPSSFPWCAQVLVVTGDNHKKRKCIDYSETINKYTLLDGNPLPNLQNLVNKVVQYSHFRTLNLKSAYHQVEISIEDRPYIAYEANGKLKQIKIISFVLTDAVPWFQRIMMKLNAIIVKEHLRKLITLLFGAIPKKNTMQTFSIRMRNLMPALKRMLQLLLKRSDDGHTIYCHANLLQ